MTPLSHTYFHPTDMHGYTLRLPSHRAIQWLRDPTFERERIRAMAQVISDHSVIFDVGSEQGDISAFLANLTAHQHVVLIEPNPAVWPCIHATFKENGFSPMATFAGFCAAEGDADATKQGWPDGEFMSWNVDPAAGFLHLAEDDAPRTTIDHLTRTVRTPDVITIDVEGAELEVLKGAVFTLKHTRPTVFVSVHERFMAHHFGQRPADLYALFDRYDYRLFHLGSDHEQHIMAVPK